MTVQAEVSDDTTVTNVDWYVDGVLNIRRPGASTGFVYNNALVASAGRAGNGERMAGTGVS